MDEIPKIDSEINQEQETELTEEEEIKEIERLSEQAIRKLRNAFESKFESKFDRLQKEMKKAQEKDDREKVGECISKMAELTCQKIESDSTETDIGTEEIRQIKEIITGAKNISKELIETATKKIIEYGEEAKKLFGKKE